MSDTHADTIPLHRDLIAQAICDGKSKNLAYASLEILVAELERERARADRAEAALRPFTHYDFAASQWIAGLTHEGHELRALWAEDVEALKGHVARARAALSTGSGGRETT